jgi:hypothetical protein
MLVSELHGFAQGNSCIGSSKNGNLIERQLKLSQTSGTEYLFGKHPSVGIE